MKKYKINKFELKKQFLKRKSDISVLNIKKALKNFRNLEKELSNEYLKKKINLSNQFNKINNWQKI